MAKIRVIKPRYNGPLPARGLGTLTMVAGRSVEVFDDTDAIVARNLARLKNTMDCLLEVVEEKPVQAVPVKRELPKVQEPVPIRRRRIRPKGPDKGL